MASSKKTGPVTNPTISAGQETAKNLSLSRKKVMVMLAPGVLLLGIGIYGVQGGFITTGNPKTTDSTTTVVDLSPPSAKPHGLKNDIKYDNNFSTGDLKPSATKPRTDQQAQSSSQMLTGQSAKVGLSSNEHLTESDLARVNQAGGSVVSPSKSSVNRQYVTDNERARREQERVMRTMYRAPKSREQLAEDRQSQEERTYNRQATERLLRQIEGSGRPASSGTSERDGAGTAVGPLYMDEYRKLRQSYGGQLPAQYADLFKREIAADQNGQGATNQVGRRQSGTMLLPDSYDVPAISNARNAFYGTGGRALRATNMPNSHNMAIPAVIHGEGDMVTVSSGSTVKIRLLEDTQLLLNGELVTLPANSLVSGICHIADERIMVTVNTLRQGNYLYETDLVAYDLDGRVGLRVPHLNEKNRMAQAIGQTAQSSAMSPAYLIPQGGVGQQLGAQVAVQTGTTIFQGAKALIQGKLAAPKASIKPNHRIFLKSGGRTGAGKALADF
ncbi:conjugative transposon protein TraM [uncultured Fibrella sp.]|uniref:conjugative transposon protein TraM n=1 Tax=uncultured Fibrella sp. TaxID=1284596 RepID=UPI0035CC5AA2